MTEMRNSIRNLLTGVDNDRKTLSIALSNDLLQKLDELSEITASICGRTVTRQSVIETAIDAYVKEYEQILQDEYGVKLHSSSINEEINTLVVPAHADGLDTLLNGEWFWLRIGKDKIDKIKYLAIYFGTPVQAITHIATVDKLTKHPSGFKASLSKVNELENPIPLGDISSLYVRPNRYISKERLLSATTYADLVDLDENK